MTATFFVDTNIFLYALDPADPRKQVAARVWRDELWRTGRGRVSVQVLQEFYANALRKWPNAMLTARAEVKNLFAWRPVVLEPPLVESAWKLQDRYQLSFWDSLIVAAAKFSSCRYLLTEDLPSGQDLDGIVVTNPFQTIPASLLP